ncbi:VOC family protein [Luteimonas sp. M1R5S18]|uniref:VOC family protein n=1 Tax=Luteimonas rhizosphaericola TaxID=3042024 RepID=A0ABT6JHP8_9GAMM|nr:VOC family protein [Luteimonas rhizosphaericola]MDH5830201.1 VOC family protein [Luteimonas rhizosphaericola]
MLKHKTSSAIVAVSDLDRARRFYADTLGLELDGDGGEGVLTFRTGDTWLVVYPSKGLRPGTGNAVVWSGGGDVAAIAADLRGKGVRMEEYPEMGLRIEAGVHLDEGFAGIWFKDPDGNILHVNSF